MAKKKSGPRRGKDSVRKIPCAWKGCRSSKDVKNVSTKLQVDMGKVDMTQCRTSLRRDAKMVKFCCQQHRDRCITTQAQLPRGQREPLEADQIVDLFYRLVSSGKPWAAFLCLLQLQCGDRADCARQCRASWLHLDSTTTPSIMIPPINGKTKSRRIPLHPQFAALVSDWMFKSPLTDKKTDCTWPFPGQKVTGTAPLFPGLSKRAGHGQWWKRQWSKPVSERAYLGALKDVAQVLKREQRKSGSAHLWSDVDVDKLGTHSLKRSAATWPNTIQFCKILNP